MHREEIGRMEEYHPSCLVDGITTLLGYGLTA